MKLGDIVSISMKLIVTADYLISLKRNTKAVNIAFVFTVMVTYLFGVAAVTSLSRLGTLVPGAAKKLTRCALTYLKPFPAVVSVIKKCLFYGMLSSNIRTSVFTCTVKRVFRLPVPGFSCAILIAIVLLVTGLGNISVFTGVRSTITCLVIKSVIVVNIVNVLKLNAKGGIDRPVILSTS